MKPRDSVDCILEVNGSDILLIKRGKDPFKGYWALPGGRINYDELEIDALMREMKEETNLKLEYGSLDNRIEMLNNQGYYYKLDRYDSGNDPRGGNTHVYVVRIVMPYENMAKNIKAGDDAIDIKLCDKNNLPRLAFQHEQFIQDYRVKCLTK